MDGKITIISVIYFFMVALFFQFASPPPSLGADAAKTIIIDTIGFSLLGGGLGLAYTYTIGDMPDTSAEKKEYLRENVRSGLLYGALFGVTIGIIDVLDVFGGGSGTEKKNKGDEQKVTPRFFRKYSNWSKTALIQVDGSKINCKIPGICAGRTMQDTGKNSLSFSVTVLNVSL